MFVFATSVYIQVTQQFSSQDILRKHTFHYFFQ